jgi:hypothetical protein
MVTVPRLWPESTIICLASGPSLTQEDVDYVRGLGRVIAINDSFRLAPWADVWYACDDMIWKLHHRRYRRETEAFTGLKYALQRPAARWAGVQVLRNTGVTGLELEPTGLKNGRNSGYQAINLAVHLGAKRIVLLGYDMSLGPRGRSHWFDDHRPRSPLTTFRKIFPTIAKPLRDLGVEVINSSRRSALTCFPKVPLERALPRQVAA